jgi:hypothetical protein
LIAECRPGPAPRCTGRKRLGLDDSSELVVLDLAVAVEDDLIDELIFLTVTTSVLPETEILTSEK